MAVVAIAQKLNEKRSFLDCITFGPFKCFSNLKDIVSINSNAGNGIASCIDIRVHGSFLNWSPHAILIILANE
jgi:hypothetical protein